MSNTTYGAANINNGYAILTWTINGDTVTFSLDIKARAWFAIGFGNGVMTNYYKIDDRC